MLRIGIPSVHSRLHPKVMRLLGIPPLADPQRLVFYAPEAAVFLLRGWDIASLVASDRLDVAFCGSDTIAELGSPVHLVRSFREQTSQISLCTRRGVTIDWTAQVTVATEYPRLTRDRLAGHAAEIQVLAIHGATEALPHLDRVDAIVDIVESGETLRRNDLAVLEVLFETCPCLIQRPGFVAPEGFGLERLARLVSEALRRDSPR